MPLGRTNLFFDQIEVIEEPFPGWRDTAFFLNGSSQKLAGFDEEVFIFSQPREKLVLSAFLAQLMRAGKRLAMLLHLVGAEQLQAQRRRIGRELLGGAISTEARPVEQAPEKGVSRRVYL